MCTAFCIVSSCIFTVRDTPLGNGRWSAPAFVSCISPLKKNTYFIWTDECEESFQELKRRLTTSPVLILLDPSEIIEVYCDASHQGLGCVLM